jgi:hypothetical protein
MWEQVVSLAQEPWVMPGIAYGALWVGLIGLKLVYKKIKVKPPLADEQLQLFNYLQGLTAKVDGWQKLGDNAIQYPSTGTRPQVKIAFTGDEQVMALGAEDLKKVLTKRQGKRLNKAAAQIAVALDERAAKAKLNTMIASVR